MPEFIVDRTILYVERCIVSAFTEDEAIEFALEDRVDDVIDAEPMPGSEIEILYVGRGDAG